MPFSSREEEWIIWPVKWMSRESRKMLKAVMMGKVMPPKHDATVEKTMDDEKKQLAAQLANNMAY